MAFAEIKDAVDRMNVAFEEFKKTNDERLEAVRKGQDARAAELDQKLAKIDKDIAQFTELKRRIEVEQETQRDRIEELEARAKSPGKTMSQKRQDEYKAAFIDWVRNKGVSPIQEQQMQDLQRKMIEAKDVTIGSTAGGGYAVPEEISREIDRLELLFSPVRSLVKVVRVGTSDYKELINLRGATSGWVGELGSGSPAARLATSTPQLREVTPTHGELYAYPQASEWSLDDIFFNVEAWLAEEVAQEFALQEGTAVISGDGTSKPTGLLKTTPVTTEDFASPLRAATAYQYVASSTGTSPAAPTSVNGDALIDVIYKLRSPYRAGAAFVANSATIGSIRKLKDAQGQYLWQPSLQAGQPNMLLGFPIVAWEQMPSIAADAHPIAFGNFRRGYTLTDRTGLRITRDNVTNIGFVRFYIRRREGGIPTNNDAIKFIRTVD